MDSISQGCHKALKHLEEKLNEYQKSDSTKGIGGQARRVLRRLDWDLNDIDQLRNQIISQINFFNAFQVELNRYTSPTMFRTQQTLMVIREVSEATGNVVDQLNSHHEHRFSLEELRQILDWLTPASYAPQQNDIFSVRQDGTGQWLLDSPEFQKLMSGDGETLFLRGLPGSGKTLLMSNLIHHLRAKS